NDSSPYGDCLPKRFLGRRAFAMSCKDRAQVVVAGSKRLLVVLIGWNCSGQFFVDIDSVAVRGLRIFVPIFRPRKPEAKDKVAFAQLLPVIGRLWKIGYKFFKAADRITI